MKKRMTVFMYPMIIIISGCSTLHQQEYKTAENKPNIEQTVAAINNTLPEGNMELIDEFENENFWYSQGHSKKDDYSVDAEITDEWSTNGSYSGLWSFSKIPETGEAAFICETLPSSDWKNAEGITADINNISQNSITLFIETQGGPFHTVSKTESVSIGIGENINVFFSLRHGIKNSEGENISEIYEKDDIRSISFKIKGRSRAGSIQIDNINLVRQSGL